MIEDGIIGRVISGSGGVDSWESGDSGIGDNNSIDILDDISIGIGDNSRIITRVMNSDGAINIMGGSNSGSILIDNFSDISSTIIN